MSCRWGGNHQHQASWSFFWKAWITQQTRCCNNVIVTPLISDIVTPTTLHHCCSSFTGCQCQNKWLSNFASWCIAVCMVSALNTSRKTSGSCPRFILASDCVRPPVPTLWFLPHAGLHLATEHSWSQELERGTRYRPVSPPHHPCPHSSDSWRLFQWQLCQ